MSQSFGGRGLDKVPLETVEKRGIKYDTYFIRQTSPSFQQSVLLSTLGQLGVFLQKGSY